MKRNYFDAAKESGNPVDFSKSPKPRIRRFGPTVVDPRAAPPHDDEVDAFGFTEEERQDAKNRYQKKYSAKAPDFEPYTEEKKPMSNKFLPFIVDSSTPKNIFKTLMSRSKGMNSVLIASIFNLTLKIDIKKLRSTVKELPEMPLEKVYEELLQKFPQHRVDEEVLYYAHNVIKLFPPGDYAKQLSEFSAKDKATFFCVISKSKYPFDEYSKTNFKKIHDFKVILENFKEYVHFSDEGVVTKFSGLPHLKTFILYNAIFRPQFLPDYDTPRIKAEFGAMTYDEVKDETPQ